MSDISFPTAQPLAGSRPSGHADHGVVALVGPQAGTDSNWALLRVHGTDATTFLHAQLSQDVIHMSANTARLAAWCNAKGRMVASCVLVREQGATPEATGDTTGGAADGSTSSASYLLLCRRDILPTFIRKLKMYVLRSKVVLEDASASMAAYGLLGDAAQQAWQTSGGSMPDAPWQCLSVQDAATNCSRYLVSLYPAAASAQAAAMPRALYLQAASEPAPPGSALPLWQWEWAEAASGVASIGQACTELFVPQMVNFESVGGVSFKKGCYPGQEVVARSQFRGAIKRRGHIAMLHMPHGCHAQLQAGSEVWLTPTPHAPHADHPASSNQPTTAEPCGTVVQAASQGECAVALISLQTTALEAVQQQQGLLHLGSADGAVLHLCPLPYPLIEV